MYAFLSRMKQHFFHVYSTSFVIQADIMRFTTHQYDYTPMQYTAIFHDCKNDHFQIKPCDNLFLIKTNIVGLTEAAPLTSIHDVCFRAKIRKMLIRGCLPF